ncbi:MAG: hypothetical protein LAT57_07630 [Balneolales bacterium]|nr:hypothetical protein [Balneolales bacterium]
MKTIKQFNISLLIRGIIIPVILLSTVVGGVRLYEEVVEIITFGFHAKLATLSSTAGAFVRLEDHDALIQPRTMTKIRQNGAHDTWLVLSEEGTIHQIHPDGSASLLPFYPAFDSTTTFTDFAVFNDTIYAFNYQNELQMWSTSGRPLRSEIQPLHTETRPFHTETSPVRSNVLSLREDATITVNTQNGNLAWGPDLSGAIYITNRNLAPFFNIDASEITILDFAFNADGNLILLTANQELIEINITTGEWSDPISITCAEPDPCPIIHSLAFQKDESIYGLSDALVLMNTSGAMDFDFYAHPGYHDHTADQYLDYIVPMREIRKKQNLTYFYTFVLNEQDRTISYVFDASTDDAFTPIGYVDDELLIEDFIAAREVLITSEPYVSSIKSWGQWGLVKIGFAPIYSMENKAGAIMGADQNVSSISQVAREALVILTLNSFVFLLFGATASWFIARSLTAPLLAMKDNVLSIAAGFLDRYVADPSLKDLRPLASLFKKAGDNLKKEVVQGPQILNTFETMRREQDYLSYLSMKLRRNDSPYFECDVHHDDHQRIAFCIQDKIAFGWILSSDVDSSRIPVIHNGVYQLCEALSSGNLEPGLKLEQVSQIFGDSLSGLALLDANTNQIVSWRQDSISKKADKSHTASSPKGMETETGKKLKLTDDKATLTLTFSMYSDS